MGSDLINPKCPDCGRCIDVHYEEDWDEWYCPSHGCQTYWSRKQVVR